MGGLSQHVDVTLFAQKALNEVITGSWSYSQPITSTVPKGIAPFIITSDELVIDLNADMVDGFHVGTSGGVIPIMDATNVWSGSQRFSTQVHSTVSTGAAPFVIASTTVNANLNADMVDGAHVGASGAAIPLLNATNSWAGSQRFTTQIVSQVTTGTAPFNITSTTLVANLNADQVDGRDVGTSGSAIPLLNGTNSWAGTQTFTTQFASSVTTGTQPFTVTSITRVTNLNADMTDGSHVGTAGSVIPLLNGINSWSGTQTFTTQFASSVTTGTAPFTVASTTLVANLNADMVDDKNVGTSGNTIPLLDGTNTWSGSQTFSTQLVSSVSTGTAPFSIASTTLVTNLNADLLDGKNTGTSGNVIGLLDGANTISGACTYTATQTFDHTSADTVAAIFNVDDGGAGFAKAFQGKVGGVTKLEWGNSFGLAGFVNPANDFFFFGMGNAQNYFLMNGAGNATSLVCGSSGWDFDSTQLNAGTKNFLTTGSVTAGTANLAAGGSTTRARVAGIIFDHFTDVGNSGTSETDLATDTLAASILSADGQKIRAFYSLNILGSATATSQLKVYFAGTARFDSGALALSTNGNWQIYVELVRTSSSTVRITIGLQSPGATNAVYSAQADITGLTLTNTQVLKITGTRAGVGAASNDILHKHSYGEWMPAA